MTPEILKAKFLAIKSKRDALVQLKDQPGLGSLQIDVIQAIEEMDDLIVEFAQVFPALQ